MKILGLHSIYKLSYNISFWRGSQAPVQPPTQNRVNAEFIPVFSELCQLDLKSLQGQRLAHLSQSVSVIDWPHEETNSPPPLLLSSNLLCFSLGQLPLVL